MPMMTELESCVLGVVWLRGPCTAYVVRQEFLASESSHWSGSGGAIYPLLRRLEKEKLIRAKMHAWGSGSKKEFEITDRGLEELRAWIGPPLPQWTAAPTFDPVRTRLSFLGAVTPAKRVKFVDEARRNAAAEIQILQGKLEEHDRDAEPFEHLVLRGTLRELEARANWLEELAVEISGAKARRAPRAASGG